MVTRSVWMNKRTNRWTNAADKQLANTMPLQTLFGGKGTNINRYLLSLNHLSVLYHITSNSFEASMPGSYTNIRHTETCWSAAISDCWRWVDSVNNSISFICCIICPRSCTKAANCSRSLSAFSWMLLTYVFSPSTAAFKSCCCSSVSNSVQQDRTRKLHCRTINQCFWDIAR